MSNLENDSLTMVRPPTPSTYLSYRISWQSKSVRHEERSKEPSLQIATSRLTLIVAWYEDWAEHYFCSCYLVRCLLELCLHELITLDDRFHASLKISDALGASGIALRARVNTI